MGGHSRKSTPDEIKASFLPQGLLRCKPKVVDQKSVASVMTTAAMIIARNICSWPTFLAKIQGEATSGRAKNKLRNK